MKDLQYDEAVDAAYLQIEDTDVLESEEIAEGIIVDYDNNEKIVAIELLGVKTILASDLSKLTNKIPEVAKETLHQFILKKASIANHYAQT